MKSLLILLLVPAIAHADTEYDYRARAVLALSIPTPVVAPVVVQPTKREVVSVAPAPRPVLQPPVRPAIGPLHSHRCGSCGFVWSHGEASQGNVAEHLCPRCHTGPWWNKFSGSRVEAAPTPIPQQMVLRLPQPFMQASCPTGH